jgi:carboxyl-terminal processing protease
MGELNKIEMQLADLEAIIANNLEVDLGNSKDEIRYFIKEEFVSRILLEDGALEASFEVDQDVKKAIEILSDQSQYTQILKGN